MLQLRRFRSLTLSDGSKKELDLPFDPDLQPPDICELINNFEKWVEKIPSFERWNCHYTQGDVPGGKKRGKTFMGQSLIPFDIDGIAVNSKGEFNPDIIEIFFRITSADKNKTVVVFSGGGLHFLICNKERFETDHFFRKHKKAYAKICDDLEAELKKQNIPIKEVDRQVFSKNKTLRLPGTINVKDGRPKRLCRLISGVLEPQDFFGSVTAEEKDMFERQESKAEGSLALRTNDTPAILSGCSFLKFAHERQAELSESQWRAAINLWAKLEGGRELAHEGSKGHPGYNVDQTNQKFDEAVSFGKPMLCDTIDDLWKGCGDCSHHGKVKTPVQIKDKTFVKTQVDLSSAKDAGFYHFDSNGKPHPDFESLLNYFVSLYSHVVNSATGAVYVFNGKKYLPWPKLQLKAFAHEHFNPKPRKNTVDEFCDWVPRINIRDKAFFNHEGFINFNNGVLELSTGRLLEHSTKYGFLYVLPYDYEPTAACPEFDAMMHRVTCKDLELENLLLEFVGFGLCDQSYWLQKALLLVGDGANGKSTFLNVVKEIAGKENTSPLSLSDLNCERSRSMLEGKLFNISDEMPTGNVKNTELLKKILGGEVTTRRLWENADRLDNMAKLIFACNKIPATQDNSHGLFRRLIIVPFDARFEPQDVDHGLMAKLRGELPGIFNRVLQAYRNLKKRGHLAKALKSEVELNLYREETDIAGTWIKENVSWTNTWGEDESVIALCDIYTGYNQYCIAANLKRDQILNKHEFGVTLRQIIPNTDKRRARRYVTLKDKTRSQQWCYAGCSFIKQEVEGASATSAGLKNGAGVAHTSQNGSLDEGFAEN